MNLLTFLVNHQDPILQQCRTELQDFFGAQNEEWLTWLWQSFLAAIKKEPPKNCLFAENKISPGKSISVLDRFGLALRRYLLASDQEPALMATWIMEADETLISMRKFCLETTLPETMSLLYANKQLVPVLNQVGQQILQVHSETEIFEAIGKGLAELQLHLALLKKNPETNLWVLAAFNDDQNACEHISHLSTVDKDTDYQFDLPQFSILDECIHNHRSKFFLPEEGLFSLLFSGLQNKNRQSLEKVYNRHHAIVVPMLKDSVLIGLLGISGRHLMEAEIPLITIFTNQVTIALENAALYQALNARSEELAGLIAISQLITVEHTIEDIIQLSASIIRKFLKFDRLSLILTMEDGDHVYSIHQHTAKQRFTHSKKNHYSNQLKYVTPVLVGDLRVLNSDTAKTLTEDGALSALMCPVFSRGTMLGTFNFTSMRLNDYTRDDIPIAQSIVDQMAPLIDNALLYTQLQHSEARFRTFYERAAIGISVYDWQSQLWDPNPAFLSMLGYAPTDDETTHQLTIQDFRVSDENATHRDDYQDLVEGKVNVYQDESRYRTKTGAIIWAKVVISIVRDPFNQQPLFTIVLLEDITDRKLMETAYRQSEQKYRSLFNSISDPVIVFDPETYAILDYNQAMLDVFEYPESDLQRMRVSEILLSRSNETNCMAIGVQYADYYTHTGRKLEVEVRTESMDYKSHPAWISTIRDISERRRVEKAIVDSELKYRSLFELSVDAILIMDEKGNIRDANPAALDMLETEFHKMIGSPFLALFPDEDKQAFQLLGKSLMFLNMEKLEARFQTAKGKILDVELNTRRVEFLRGALQVIVRDITEQKIVENELKFMGSHDILTGLYNRNYFEIEMLRLQNSRLFPISIVAVDVDGLKSINDRFGHAAGDHLLARAAEVLRHTFRTEDVVARWGGDEFSILLPTVDAKGGLAAIQRVREHLEVINQEEAELPVSLSIGVATASYGEKLSEVLKRADELMYKDKIAKKALISATPS
ncbi:MAG: hypothetical protein CVU39_22280 [Chloroflexi bacterium HGW-Chloroflexi-10]|nr:MAG: hypothetical protein CVU39_22280 [Chloroflexi bacterium HGW-Chloroflexi-10]